jgi:hypothetical protein
MAYCCGIREYHFYIFPLIKIVRRMGAPEETWGCLQAYGGLQRPLFLVSPFTSLHLPTFPI